jgi:hypothetical protein
VNEILTNEEIDTLLQMFRSEGGAVEPSRRAAAGARAGRRSRRTRRQPDRPAEAEPPRPRAAAGLERYFESAGKLLSATIGDKLRLDTRCDCVAVEQLRFGSWLDQLPGPVAIYVLQMEPFKLPVLFTASTSLLYGAVDRILGGSGKVQKVPKDFTSAEHTVAEALVGPCLDRICESARRRGEAEVVDREPLLQPVDGADPADAGRRAVDLLPGRRRLPARRPAARDPVRVARAAARTFGRDSVAALEPGAMREKLAVTVRERAARRRRRARRRPHPPAPAARAAEGRRDPAGDSASASRRSCR